MVSTVSPFFRVCMQMRFWMPLFNIGSSGEVGSLLRRVLLLSTDSHDPCQWGESDVPACGPPASFSVHLASNAVTPAGSVHKSRSDNGVQLKICYVPCVWMLQRGHSGDGYASVICLF